MGCTDMSEAGIVINNDNNELLINATYNNLYLFRKVKLTDLPYEVLGNSSISPLRFTLNIQPNEIIAPIARTDGSSLQAFSINGKGTPGSTVNTWLIYVSRYISNVNDLLADLDNVYVYTFGINTSTTTSANGYGLQVFDENGVCVYNSNSKPMRVLHYANNVGDMTKTDAELDGYVCPSNRLCAIFNCAVARRGAGAGQSRPVYFFNAYISNSGEVKQQNTFSGGAAPFNFVMGDYIGYMVVDVTGY